MSRPTQRKQWPLRRVSILVALVLVSASMALISVLPISAAMWPESGTYTFQARTYNVAIGTRFGNPRNGRSSRQLGTAPPRSSVLHRPRAPRTVARRSMGPNSSPGRPEVSCRLARVLPAKHHRSHASWRNVRYAPIVRDSGALLSPRAQTPQRGLRTHRQSPARIQSS